MVLAPQERPGAREVEASAISALPTRPRAESGRVLGRDRLSAGVRISVELAPLRVPSRAQVVGAVRTLLGLGASARAGRVFEGTSWRYSPDLLDEQAERMVRPLPADKTGDLGLPRLREEADPDLPFTVFLGDDRASLCIDHRAGDGFLSVMLTAATLAGQGVAGVFLSAKEDDPLRAALATTFLRHADRALELVEGRLHDRRVGYDGPTVPGERGSLDLVTATMEPDVFRALAAWSRGRVPPSVAMLFALRAALERAGIPVMDEGSILVDLRRYLPSGRSTLANFVVGQPVSTADGIDAAGARFSHDLHVGRPLAALTVGVLSRGWASPGPKGVPPWATDKPTVKVSVDPAGRNGVTALTAVLRRRMNVSISFDGSLYRRDDLTAACALLCHDPKELLT